MTKIIETGMNIVRNSPAGGLDWKVEKDCFLLVYSLISESLLFGIIMQHYNMWHWNSSMYILVLCFHILWFRLPGLIVFKYNK